MKSRSAIPAGLHRWRWETALLGTLLLLVGSGLLFSGRILRHIYFHRYNPALFSRRTAIDEQNRSLYISLGIDITDSLYSIRGGRIDFAREWFDGRMEMDGYSRAVRVGRFIDPFKYLKLDRRIPPVSIRTSASSSSPGNRHFDLFSAPRIEFFEQQFIYFLGERLGLLVPHTEYVDVYLDDNLSAAYNRVLKQSLDAEFLTRHNLEGSWIVMLDRDEGGGTLRPLIRGDDDPAYIRHIDAFMERLRAGDEYLLKKFFDSDYMARFEALRILIGAQTAFVLEDNIRLVFNTSDGLFYPILDEANLLNLQVNRRNRSLALLADQIDRDAVIRKTRAVHLAKLADRSDEILQRHEELQRRFLAASSNWRDRQIIRLTARYLEGAVRARLREYTGPVRAVNEPEGRPPLAKAAAYADEIRLSAAAFIRGHPELDMVEEGGKVRLRAGDYTLDSDLIIPRGCPLRIDPGVNLRMSPGKGLLSFSPVEIAGTPADPVRIEAGSPAEPFGMVAICPPPGASSVIRNLRVSGAAGGIRLGAGYSAGLCLRGGHADLDGVRIENSRGCFALEAAGATLDLKNIRMDSGSSGAARLRGCRGILSAVRIRGAPSRSEADGLIAADCRLFIEDGAVRDFSGKGLLSRRSELAVSGNRITGNKIGIGAVDSSRLLVMENRFEGNRRSVEAFADDEDPGMSRLFLFNNGRECGRDDVFIEKGSLIYFLDSRPDWKRGLAAAVRQRNIPLLAAGFSRIQKEADRDLALERLSVGDRSARVVEDDRVVFVNLPSESSGPAALTAECRPPGGGISIRLQEGRSGGGNRPGPEKRLSEDVRLRPGESLIRGSVRIHDEFRDKSYDLIVTTGDLAVMEIDTRDEFGDPREIPDDPKAPCRVRILAAESSRRISGWIPAGIETRGQTGKTRPKRKYGISLSESLPLEGMPASRHWVLESSFVEKSLMRSKLAFDLLARIRPADSRMPMAPRSRFVEVLIDGEYQGVYLLMEHVDRGFLGLDGFDRNQPVNALLFRAENKNANFSRWNDKSHYAGDYRLFPGGEQPLDKTLDPIWGWHSGFDQRYPHPDRHGEFWGALEDLIRFAATAPERLFESRIFDYIDREAFIDLWIFSQVVDDQDGLSKNRYLARRKGEGERWWIIPWDKDGVLGRRHDMKRRRPDHWLTTPLFERCLRIEAFRAAYKARWSELRTRGTISADGLHEQIDRLAAVLGDARERNFRRWPTDLAAYPDYYDFEREIDYLKRWIRERIAWLDVRIEEL